MTLENTEIGKKKVSSQKSKNEIGKEIICWSYWYPDYMIYHQNKKSLKNTLENAILGQIIFSHKNTNMKQ